MKDYLGVIQVTEPGNDEYLKKVERSKKLAEKFMREQKDIFVAYKDVDGLIKRFYPNKVKIHEQFAWCSTNDSVSATIIPMHRLLKVRWH